NVMLSETYEPTSQMTNGDSLIKANGQAFELTSRGTGVVTLSLPTYVDLIGLNTTESKGWVLQGVIQEIELGTGKVVFEWKSLDHIPLNETFATLATDGDGKSPATAFNYLDVNSVSLTTFHGDNFLVSGHNTHTIYFINRTTSNVDWRLNGKASSFSLSDAAKFHYQHDVHFLGKDENDIMLISLFNNDANSHTKVSPQSAGLTLVLDINQMTATLKKRYAAPTPGISSPTGGNLQQLSNGNYFIGWGAASPFFTEFLPNGTVVMHVEYAPLNATTGGSPSITRSAWNGRPQDEPLIAGLASGSGNNQSTTYYASWNGATEVAAWQFHAVDLIGGTPKPTVMETVQRTGFETQWIVKGKRDMGFAEAVDWEGKVLGETDWVNVVAA
ncbi:hypothetical protein K402DRAFT_301022, partial [Aulographum hederae CBS 113979]